MNLVKTGKAGGRKWENRSYFTFFVYFFNGKLWFWHAPGYCCCYSVVLCRMFFEVYDYFAWKSSLWFIWWRWQSCCCFYVLCGYIRNDDVQLNPLVKFFRKKNQSFFNVLFVTVFVAKNTAKKPVQSTCVFFVGVYVCHYFLNRKASFVQKCCENDFFDLLFTGLIMINRSSSSNCTVKLASVIFPSKLKSTDDLINKNLNEKLFILYNTKSIHFYLIWKRMTFME